MTTEAKRARLTVRDAAKWKRTDEQITDLARRILMREVMVTNDPRHIECGFAMMLMMVSITKAATTKVGALIGEYAETTGMAMNGVPIFTSLGFVHIDDMPWLFAEMDRMAEALGIKP